MASDWKKAEFKHYGSLPGVSGELVREANDALAQSLSANLSAFLRTTVTAGYAGGGEMLFAEFAAAEEKSCAGSALVRPGDRKLVLDLEHSILFPLVGIALGAKAGSFLLPGRKPTEIELQVVQLLFRMILGDAYRAWAKLANTQLDTVTLEIERAGSRALPQAERVFASRFELSLGDNKGQLVLLVPPELFGTTTSEQEATGSAKPADGELAQATLDLLMAGKMSLDIWLDGSEMKLGDLLQLREGQIVRLDHPVERRAVCTVNGKPTFSGQIVSTGLHRGFQVEDFTSLPSRQRG